MQVQFNEEVRLALRAAVKTILAESTIHARSLRRTQLSLVQSWKEGGREDLFPLQSSFQVQTRRALLREQTRQMHILYAFLRGTSLRRSGMAPTGEFTEALLRGRPGLIWALMLNWSLVKLRPALGLSEQFDRRNWLEHEQAWKGVEAAFTQWLLEAREKHAAREGAESHAAA